MFVLPVPRPRALLLSLQNFVLNGQHKLLFLQYKIHVIFSAELLVASRLPFANMYRDTFSANELGGVIGPFYHDNARGVW